MSPTEMVMAEMKETINSLKAENENLKEIINSERRLTFACGKASREVAVDYLKQIEKLKAALKIAEGAFDDLFYQCASNGMTNAWGKPIDHTKLNEAMHTIQEINRAKGEP